MAKETKFEVKTSQVFTTATAVKLADLRKKENFKSPFARNRCPYTDGQSVGDFEGFAVLDWESDTHEGSYLGIKLSGIKEPMSLSMFIKESEDAVDTNGQFIHIENPNEGLSAIMRKYSDLTDELLAEVETFLKEEGRTIKITKFITLTPWGKRQARNLINII